MKKLAALLAALMLPLCALGETYGLTLSVTADRTALTQDVRRMLDASGTDADAEKMADFIAGMLDGLRAEVVFQADARWEASLSLPGREMLTLLGGREGEAAYLMCPLLTADTLQWAVDQADPDAHLQRWLADLPAETATGAFRGDAFDGGARCTTWTIDAAALESLAQAISPVWTLLCGEGQADGALLRAVYDEHDALIGVTVTAMAAETQIATASLGLRENGCTLVLGLGLAHENYWWELNVSRTLSDNVTFLRAVSREWTAPKTDSFAYARAMSAPVSTGSAKVTITRTAEKYLWEASIALGDEPLQERIFTASGVAAPSSGVLTGQAKAGAFTVNVALMPHQALDAPDMQTIRTLDESTASAFVSLLRETLRRLFPLDQLHEMTAPAQ